MTPKEASDYVELMCEYAVDDMEGMQMGPLGEAYFSQGFIYACIKLLEAYGIEGVPEFITALHEAYHGNAAQEKQ